MLVLYWQKPPRFYVKTEFVSDIAFTEYRGFIFHKLLVKRKHEIHSLRCNECSALFWLYLRCRSRSRHPCCFMENFFLLCPWSLSRWDAVGRNSSLRGASSRLPLAVPSPMANPGDPRPCASPTAACKEVSEQHGASPLFHQHKPTV